MMKKKILILLLSVLFIALSAACSSDTNTQFRGAGTYMDFVDSGARIGVQSGEVFNDVARDLFKAKEVPEYKAMADLLEDLRAGRIDAAMTNGSYVKQLQDSNMFPEFDYLWVDTEFYSMISAPVFHTTELRGKYN